MAGQQGPQSERINTADDHELEGWAKKLDVTAMQLRDAVAQVGDKASDVEMHLKGVRSTTNDDRVEEAGG